MDKYSRGHIYQKAGDAVIELCGCFSYNCYATAGSVVVNAPI